MKRSLLVVGLALALAAGARADAPRARVRLEPAEVFIGTPARLTVEVEGPAGLQLDGGALGDALGKIDGARPGPLRREELPGEGDTTRVRYRLEAAVTRFELGEGPGQQVTLPYRGAGEGALEIWLPEPRVVPVPSRPGDDPESLREAKGTVDPPPLTLPWWAGGLALLVVGGALYAGLFGRRGPLPEPPPPPPEPPFDRAMRLLERLEREGDGGDPRSFHYRLSEVLREYLCARYGLPGLSETSFELVAECRSAGLDALLVERVERLLDALDVVKFGPDEAGRDLSTLHLARCQDLVRETEPRPEPPPSAAPAPGPTPEPEPPGGSP